MDTDPIDYPESLADYPTGGLNFDEFLNSIFTMALIVVVTYVAYHLVLISIKSLRNRLRKVR